MASPSPRMRRKLAVNSSQKFWICSKNLCDKIPRQTVAKSSHVSRTRRQPLANVRRHIASYFPRSTKCDKYYAIQILCDISRRDCDKITLSDTHTTVARHSRECLTTVVRVSSILLRICRDHNVQWDCNYDIVENLRLYHKNSVSD